MGLYKGLDLQVLPTDSEHRGLYEAARAGRRAALHRPRACDAR